MISRLGATWQWDQVQRRVSKVRAVRGNSGSRSWEESDSRWPRPSPVARRWGGPWAQRAQPSGFALGSPFVFGHLQKWKQPGAHGQARVTAQRQSPLGPGSMGQQSRCSLPSRLPWPLQCPPRGQWLCSPGAHSACWSPCRLGSPRPPFLSLLRPPRGAESDAVASPRLPEPPVGAPPRSYPVSVRSSLLGKSAPPTAGRGARGSRRRGEGVDFWPVSFIPSISVATAAAGSPHSSLLGAARKQRPERGRATETWVGPAAQEEAAAEAAAGLRPSPPFPACLTPQL